MAREIISKEIESVRFQPCMCISLCFESLTSTFFDLSSQTKLDGEFHIALLNCSNKETCVFTSENYKINKHKKLVLPGKTKLW